MEKSFARKLDGKPFFNSLIFGAAAGTFIFILSGKNMAVGVVFGIMAFLILSIIVYPRDLPALYGFWRITDQKIYYYDYSTWKKRVSAIFLPIFTKQQEVDFNDINAYSLVVTKKESLNRWEPHFIALQLDNGQNLNLDLSWNLSRSGKPGEDVEKAVNLINSKVKPATSKSYAQ